MANIQALILDFDGVLVESNQVKTEAFKEQEELRNIVRYRRFETYFRDINGDPQVRKKEAIQTVIKKEGAGPQEVLFIGDSLSDLNAARDTDVRFIGRNSGLPFPDGDIELYKDMFQIAEALRQQLGENTF